MGGRGVEVGFSQGGLANACALISRETLTPPHTPLSLSLSLSKGTGDSEGALTRLGGQ
jgi:hypothetical protein